MPVLQLSHTVNLFIGIEVEHLFQLIGIVGTISFGCDVCQLFGQEQLTSGTIYVDGGFSDIIRYDSFCGRECHYAVGFAVADGGILTGQSSYHQTWLHLVLVAQELGYTQRAVIDKAQVYVEVVPVSQQTIGSEFVAGRTTLSLVVFHSLLQACDCIRNGSVVARGDGCKHRLSLTNGGLQKLFHFVGCRSLCQQLLGFGYFFRQGCTHLCSKRLMCDAQQRHEGRVGCSDSNIAVIINVTYSTCVSCCRKSHSKDEACSTGVQHLAFASGTKPREEVVAVLHVPHEKLLVVDGGNIVRSHLRSVIHTVYPPYVGIGIAGLQVAPTDHKPMIFGSDKVFAVTIGTHLEGHVVLSGGIYSEGLLIVRECTLRSTCVVC